MPRPSQTTSLKRLLTAPTRLFPRSEVLQKPSPVPSANRCYAWYFREVPKIVPTRGCVTFERARHFSTSVLHPTNKINRTAVRRFAVADLSATEF